MTAALRHLAIRFGWLMLVCLLGCAPKQIDFARATEIANERLQAHAKVSGIDPSTLAAPNVEQRQDEWIFRWEEPKKDFSFVVIVRTNGEHFEGPKNIPQARSDTQRQQ